MAHNGNSAEILALGLRNGGEAMGGITPAAQYLRVSTGRQQFSRANQSHAIEQYAQEDGDPSLRFSCQG